MIAFDTTTKFLVGITAIMLVFTLATYWTDKRKQRRR